MAQRANVSPQYLAEVERGMKEPSSEIVHAVGGALGMLVLDMLRQAAQRIDLQNTERLQRTDPTEGKVMALMEVRCTA